MNLKLGFFGCGTMASAVLDAALRSGIVPQNITLWNRTHAKAAALAAKTGATAVSAMKELHACDVVVLGVKPQNLPEVAYEPPKNQIIISLLAGTTHAALQAKFPLARIIRTMPNLPLSVGQGVTAAYFEDDITEVETKAIQALFTAGGLFVRVAEESEIDRLTVLSGCGPGYYFAITHWLAEAAMSIGIAETTAHELAQQTFIGTAELLKQQPKASLAWQRAVTSKAGVTEAGLQEMVNTKLPESLRAGLESALLRAKELGA